MKVDGILPFALPMVPFRARELERQGFDGGLSAEVANDPFLPILLAAEHSERLELMTSIAVAFARSPMTLAQTAHDLNVYSKGRFILGLGSQVKAHITRRFSMPWSHPAARMRELILAMRAIWASWYDGQKLDFRGEFYAHTLMTPMFVPADKQYGAPRVTVAGVNPLMTETAGEVADGFVAHGFTTERYLREVTLPAIERGLAKTGRARSSFELCCPVFLVTGDDEQKFAASRDACRAQIAFYASTPSYRPVLELHGWGALQEELNDMTRKGAWAEMAGRISDEILETVAVVVPDPDKLAERVLARCGGIVDRLAFTAQIADQDRLAEQIRRLRAG